ncbi:leucyl/phenylalanyl-tRNA--protein transferase [candidate division KSB3 bacterium]|uniref:Leucyl/phenylalanyl-tRNA--protein transferase n=1 Tax=candidate division KSB3 bacterium TaxID=2044937 RepID=A0A2G6E8I0_9BACT|nr:MAG: leucyl/phenylalanyl-tRNA--protein transferase [candidate division KSB3 bacterium]PIE30674.1 MAG: leucyl/phenylalanyl-tRNA--protein transferase [candidate division KSB3 bacterium]
MPVYHLTEEYIFPAPHLSEENGLLAIGGDLSLERLLAAYSSGIFPWYEHGTPVLWWSPDPRLVLYPDEFYVSRSLRKIIRQQAFRVTLDRAFEQVIRACADIQRPGQRGTWLVDEMIRAYTVLHDAGFAHSVEAWHGGRLAGGLYGVSLGRCFFGESMFAHASNASKVALYYLTQYLKKRHVEFIDCQVRTAHLVSLGAREVTRSRFLTELKRALHSPSLRGKWTLEHAEDFT